VSIQNSEQLRACQLTSIRTIFSERSKHVIKAGVISGNWKRTKLGLGATTTGDEGGALIQVPLANASSYELEADFTRTRAGEGFPAITAILPVGSGRCQFWMDYGKEVGGLSMKENPDPRSNSAKTPQTESPENGVKHTLKIRVVLQEEMETAEIRATLDDRPYLLWKGKVADLDISPNWPPPKSCRLAIGCGQNTTVTFHRLLYRGEATPQANHSGVIRALAFGPTGKFFAGAGDDKTIRVWDSATGKVAMAFRGQQATCVSWSPIEDTIACGGKDAVVQFLDAKTGKSQTIRVASEVVSLAWSASGKNLAIGGSNKSITIWNTVSRSTKIVAQGDTGLAWSPDGKTVVTFSWEGNNLRFWTFNFSRLLGTVEVRGKIGTVAWSPDGSKLAVNGGDENDLWILDAKSGKVVVKGARAEDGWFSHLAWSSDNKVIAAAHEHGFVVLWNAETGAMIGKLGRHEPGKPIVGFAFSPDGKTVVTSATDETVRIWPTQRGKKPIVIQGTAPPK
jgi:WD40 repeat protein